MYYHLMKKIYLTIIFICLAIYGSAQIDKIKSVKYNLFDSIRTRNVPVDLYFRTDSSTKAVVIISHGYGLKNIDYSFITKRLVSLGYNVICIQHDLPTDEPLARDGNIYELRKPVWDRGVSNINFAISKLHGIYKQWDFNNLILIGHSNGGDISMLFCSRYPNLIDKVITLDNLRMPIPRIKQPMILSIRANDTKADDGVLPSTEEQKDFNIRIIDLQGKHNDFCDNGDAALKQSIILEIVKFLKY